MTHRPKGRMCVNCIRMRMPSMPCPTQEEFKDMVVIGKDKEDGMLVVKCNKFEVVNKL